MALCWAIENMDDSMCFLIDFNILEVTKFSIDIIPAMVVVVVVLKLIKDNTEIENNIKEKFLNIGVHGIVLYYLSVIIVYIAAMICG